MEKDIEYYVNLDWKLNFGTDLDYNGNLYHYAEIKEFPNFVFCAKTQERVLAGYKRKLKLHIQLSLEDGEKIYEPGEFPEEDDEFDF